MKEYLEFMMFDLNIIEMGQGEFYFYFKLVVFDQN